MSIQPDSGLVDVGSAVCTTLHRLGITAVLTGGSAAMVHAPEAVASFDLDFVMTLGANRTEAHRSLLDLGYQLEGQDYRHATNPYQLEFLPAPWPLAVTWCKSGRPCTTTSSSCMC